MIFKRTICIQSPHILGIQGGLLKLTSQSTGEIQTVYLGDIGMILLDHWQITTSQAFWQRCAEEYITVIICAKNHHPSSICIPLNCHTLHAQRLKLQIEQAEPTTKRVWKQIVKAKITNQAAVLSALDLQNQDLIKWVKEVKSGDTTNVEAKAARAYWKRLFGPSFTRRRDGVFPNNVLNYGYAIVRATTARAISLAGLHPSIGIFHSNKYNDFALADDLMEPFRPFVDLWVAKHYKGITEEELSKDTKYSLIQLIHTDCLINNQQSPLELAIQTQVNSLIKVFDKELKRIYTPNLPLYET